MKFIRRLSIKNKSRTAAHFFVILTSFVVILSSLDINDVGIRGSNIADPIIIAVDKDAISTASRTFSILYSSLLR